MARKGITVIKPHITETTLFEIKPQNVADLQKSIIFA
jgi:hypothetical protein